MGGTTGTRFRYSGLDSIFGRLASSVQRAAQGKPEWFGEDDDLYPDARSTLSKLRDEGLWVGIAGNQTVRAGKLLKGLDLPADTPTSTSR
jgi:beta-phosphoglucomutase-like phosphatase (HAD superfamily)